METRPEVSPLTGLAASPAQEKRMSAWWVLGGIFSLSVGLGVLAHHRLIYSVTSIQNSVKQFSQDGKQMTPEQCAGHVMAWAKQCGAMQSLCDASVHRLMGQCLESQSRRQACVEMDLKRSKAHFTYARCKARDLHRHPRWKKVCGGVYSALWIHCMYWKKGKIPPTAIEKTTHIGLATHPFSARPKPPTSMPMTSARPPGLRP